jgi:hypothetical protein
MRKPVLAVQKPFSSPYELNYLPFRYNLREKVADFYEYFHQNCIITKLRCQETMTSSNISLILVPQSLNESPFQRRPKEKSQETTEFQVVAPPF